MKLIVCLGNPGPEYELTRHNIGFLAGDCIVEAYGFEKLGKKFKSVLYEGRISSEKVFLIKPQTYMNLSGQAVQLIRSFYKISKEDVLVVFDDFDLPLGSMRVRPKGSAGTHNGMKSVIGECGELGIPRMRLGVGPKPSEMPTKQFVLSRFRDEELEVVGQVIEQASTSIKTWIGEGLERMMNRHNT